MRYSLFALSLLLAGCGQYEWGTVVSVREDDTALGCWQNLPVATVHLDDGRVFARCMDVAVGTRAQICLGECHTWTATKPDPMDIPGR